MRRRELLVSLIAVLGVHGSASGQDRRATRLVAVLMPTSVSDGETIRRLAALRDTLEKARWSIGRDLLIEIFYASGDLKRLPQLSGQLVSRAPDVIVTTGTESVQALMRATGTIPIVMATIGDPVAAGIVESIARPGGNITGFSLQATDISARRLQIAMELVPGLQHAAVLWNPANLSVKAKVSEILAAGTQKNVKLSNVEFTRLDELEQGIARAAAEGARAIITGDETLLVSNRDSLARTALQHGLGIVSEFKVIAEAGGLASYGPNIIENWRQAGGYVDRILRGTHPRDLPVQQPTRFELVINLKTAKALGIEVPTMLLALADEVIE